MLLSLVRLQKLHVDWGNTVVNKKYRVCNSIWLLDDDFTTENGSTRVVPKSHKLNMLPSQSLEDPLKEHPDEIITGPAGSVFIFFNSPCSMVGLTIIPKRTGRSIHSYFALEINLNK